MSSRDYTQLIGQLSEEYTRHSPKSAALNVRAHKVMVDGGSHGMRLIQPFPTRIASAGGAYVTDVDGHRILDFWQGHFANMLGHNPGVVTDALSRAFEGGVGLQTGFTDELEIEAAEVLCRQTGAERARYTTSGTLATMYAIMLARAHTGRQLVLKVIGGWHGAQPWSLKGVHFLADAPDHWGVESLGLPGAAADEIVLARYNDVEHLREVFRQYGDRLACFIVEPFVGGGGCILADPEYLKVARELTQQYGAVLILDEVMAGFRFRAGDAGKLYGVRPDLAVFGKIIGGGLPIAAVAGRADIMGLCGRPGRRRVAFQGGTFSSHPGTMLASKVFLDHMVEHEAEIYPRIGALGEKVRSGLERAFVTEGIQARCTGYPNAAIPSTCLAMLHFPVDGTRELRRSEDLFDPAVTDQVLRDQVLRLALLLENVHVEFCPGMVCAAHTDAEATMLIEACRRVARRVAAAMRA